MGLDYGESKVTTLTVDAVCAAATARTGLDDFGPDDFTERLGVQLGEMDADDDRTGLGRLLMFGDSVRYAANRLLVRDLLHRHPEILEVPITRPLIVVGLPRSGTTHLVNLLAADTRFRSMPLWESYEPVPHPEEESGGNDGVDPSWTRCNSAWEAMQAAAPLVAAMHPMEPDHVHEEIELQLPDFSSYTLEWVARAPQWRDYYLAHDQSAALRLHEDAPPDPPVVPAPGALGPQVAPAPRAARTAAGDVPRRHGRGDPPRPGGRGPVHDHHGLLRSPDRLPDASARVVPGLLDRAHRPVARRVVARPAPPARRSHRGRLLRRVHGRRSGDARAGLPLRRDGVHRPGPGRGRRLSTRPPERQGGEGRLRPASTTSPPRPRRCAPASAPTSTVSPYESEVA